jgi:hypothetical protein
MGGACDTYGGEKYYGSLKEGDDMKDLVVEGRIIGS